MIIIAINCFVIITNFCNCVDKELTKKSLECRGPYNTSLIPNENKKLDHYIIIGNKSSNFYQKFIHLLSLLNYVILVTVMK